MTNTASEKEYLYSCAHAHYEGGNYPEAEKIFAHLTLASPFEERFWLGVSSTRQMQEKYREALSGWAVLALLDEANPTPHFHAAECLLSLHERDDALKALKAAENRCTDRFLALKRKIQVLKEVHCS